MNHKVVCRDFVVVAENAEHFPHVADSNVVRIGVEGVVEEFLRFPRPPGLHVEHAELRFWLGQLRHDSNGLQIDCLSHQEFPACLQPSRERTEELAGSGIPFRHFDNDRFNVGGRIRQGLLNRVNILEQLGQSLVGRLRVLRQVDQIMAGRNSTERFLVDRIDRSRLFQDFECVTELAFREQDIRFQLQCSRVVRLNFKSLIDEQCHVVDVVFLHRSVGERAQHNNRSRIDREGLFQIRNRLSSIVLLEQQASRHVISLPRLGIVTQRVRAKRVDHEIENAGDAVPSRINRRSRGDVQK